MPPLPSAAKFGNLPEISVPEALTALPKETSVPDIVPTLVVIS